MRRGGGQNLKIKSFFANKIKHKIGSNNLKYGVEVVESGVFVSVWAAAAAAALSAGCQQA